MDRTVAIFHGYGGNKPSSWLSWLNKQLIDRGVATIYPAFPPMGSSTIKDWYSEFSKYIKDTNEPISIVGHSGGTTFSFYLAQNSDIKIEKMILVCPLNDISGADTSALVHKPEVQDQVPFIRNFVHQNFDFDIIRSRVKEFIFILSDNDHNVPYEETKKYFQNIFPEAKFITLHNYGHVNEKAGITDLPQVLDELLK
ncbi:alpha/beta hydrolase [Candidatus Woesebacteria bacterium]|nr:alpha/beta hydrolase [Candidatus Woesebacteria bacterium]